MLYRLYEAFAGPDFPGRGLLDLLAFRIILAFSTALVLSLALGGPLIRWLRKHQIGETVRDLGLAGQMSKKGTPTMGGILILLSLIVTVLLFCDLGDSYVRLLLLTALWCGGIGFADDYIKVFRHNKNGLPGPVKIILQVCLGLFVAAGALHLAGTGAVEPATATTFPFLRNHRFDYAWLIPFGGEAGRLAVRAVYVLVILLVVFFGSNGTNLTDGLDGLAAGSSAISGIAMTGLALMTAEAGAAAHFHLLHIADCGEVAVFLGAFTGALTGFLRYNLFPAKVFMGDTGSLALGGIMGVAMVLIHKELLLPVLCGVFAVEGLSVILQRYWFKLTKRVTGTGRRIFKMTPLHHHFQKEGVEAAVKWPRHAMEETRIVRNFWVAGVLCAVAAFLLILF